LIREELLQSISDFKAKGAASVLMDAKTGEVLSLISLPDYNLNTRQNIKDKNFTNKITKGVFELGSIFKTFTIALAMENDLFSSNTIIKNIPDEIKCSKYTISEHDEMPSSLSLKQILIRSSNIGTIKVARQIGENKLRTFLEDLNLLNTIDFELDEIGSPLNFSWNKCKLETVSYGHGITTTPLQLAKGYAIISNGGYDIKPTLIIKDSKYEQKKRILRKGVSKKINLILRKVVTNNEGTAGFANVLGYEVGGKTGTAQQAEKGKYSKIKINTFAAIFPTSKPKYVLIVLTTLVFQIILGIITIISGSNIYLASLHQIGSILLVLSFLYLMFNNSKIS